MDKEKNKKKAEEELQGEWVCDDTMPASSSFMCCDKYMAYSEETKQRLQKGKKRRKLGFWERLTS